MKAEGTVESNLNSLRHWKSFLSLWVIETDIDVTDSKALYINWILYGTFSLSSKKQVQTNLDYLNPDYPNI